MTKLDDALAKVDDLSSRLSGLRRSDAVKKKSGKFVERWSEDGVLFEVNVGYQVEIVYSATIGRILKKPRGMSDREAEDYVKKWIEDNKSEIEYEVEKRAQ